MRILRTPIKSRYLILAGFGLGLILYCLFVFSYILVLLHISSIVGSTPVLFKIFDKPRIEEPVDNLNLDQTNTPDLIDLTETPVVNFTLVHNLIDSNIFLSSSAFLETRFFTHAKGPHLLLLIIGTLRNSTYNCIYTTRTGRILYSQITQSPFPTDTSTSSILTCVIEFLSPARTWDAPVRVTIGEANQTLVEINDPVWARITIPPESPFPPLIDFNTYENVTAGSMGMCIPPMRGIFPVEAITGFLETYRSLGMDQFYLYNMSGSGESMQIFENAPDVQIIQWSLPSHTKKDGATSLGNSISGDEIYSNYKLRIS
jgi:hypothetical protein